MGAKQSRSKEKTKEPMLSQEDVIHLLMVQRVQVYEELRKEFVDKARSGGAGNSTTTVSSQPASPSSVQIPVTPSQPTLDVVKPAGHSSHSWTQDASSETQHAPYRHTGNDFPERVSHSAQSASTNLYPTLETVTAYPLNAHVDNTNRNTAQELMIVNNSTQIERIEPTTPVLPRLYRDVPSSRPPSLPPVKTENWRADNRPLQASAPVPPQTENWRADTRSRNNNELCCSTCKSTWGLRIYKCDSGHISCETCKMDTKICGICSAYIREPANLQRERYLATKKVPCPHRSDGCRLLIKNADLQIHVKECPFMGLKCPLHCRWEGKLVELCGHFDAVRPEHRTADIDTEILIRNISKNSQNLFLVLLRPYNFLFHVKIQNRTIYMTAQLIGTKMSAEKWSYEVHVYNKNDSGRMFKFEDVCSSYVVPVADLFGGGSCLILPEAYASTFVLDGGLTYKFFIKKSFYKQATSMAANKQH